MAMPLRNISRKITYPRHVTYPGENILDTFEVSEEFKPLMGLDSLTFEMGTKQDADILNFEGQQLENISWNEEDRNVSVTQFHFPNETMELPIDMRFGDANLLSIIFYSILMFLSAFGNLFILWNIIKIRMKNGRLGRVNFLIMHLAIADLLVTFFMMPLEIGWNYTISWMAGDLVCRIMAFFRTFGLYLSGFMISCISVDRYFAIVKPFTIPGANRRGRIMIYMAWTGSIICSLPQAWVFRLESHPVFTWYEQCITFNTFSSKVEEMMYNFFGFTFMYAFPMTAILFCCGSILYEIYKVNAFRSNEELRRSSMVTFTRAKTKAFKMAMTIVISFFCCWTPYNVMTLWYWFDKETASAVDPRIQKILFLFASTNAVVNPLVYGLFHINSINRRKNQNLIRQTIAANNSRLLRNARLGLPLDAQNIQIPVNCDVDSNSEHSRLHAIQIPMINM